MYDALKAATADLVIDSEFTVNTIDSCDLCKLTDIDLVSRDYDEEVAERVSIALRKHDLRSFGESIGLKISVSPNAPRLTLRS